MNAPHTIQLTYIGGPTLLIEFGGLRLLTDPTFDAAGLDYTTGPVTLSKTMSPAVSVEALGHVDAVLLSHDHHFDNLDHAGRALLAKADTVLTTTEGAARLGGHALGLMPWQERTIGGRVRVTGTPAQHGPEGADRGPVTGFVLQLEDGEGTIYISGDTVWFDGVEETLRRFPGIDVAVLFLGAAQVPVVQGHLTFTAVEAVRVAQQLSDAILVPLHFEGWKHFTESQEQIAQTFAKAGVEHRVKWLTAGEPSLLSK